MSNGTVTISIEEYDRLRNYSNLMNKKYEREKESYKKELEYKKDDIEDVYYRTLKALEKYRIFIDTLNNDIYSLLEHIKWKVENQERYFIKLKTTSFWNIRTIKKYVEAIIEIENTKHNCSGKILEEIANLTECNEKYIELYHKRLNHCYRK